MRLFCGVARYSVMGGTCPRLIVATFGLGGGARAGFGNSLVPDHAESPGSHEAVTTGCFVAGNRNSTADRRNCPKPPSGRRAGCQLPQGHPRRGRQVRPPTDRGAKTNPRAGPGGKLSESVSNRAGRDRAGRVGAWARPDVDPCLRIGPVRIGEARISPVRISPVRIARAPVSPGRGGARVRRPAPRPRLRRSSRPLSSLRAPWQSGSIRRRSDRGSSADWRRGSPPSLARAPGS